MPEQKQKVICPYCGDKAQLVQGSRIYPHRRDLSKLHFYLCDNPEHEEAYVGCHRGTTNPLGRLADAELRKAKSEAHLKFDCLWRQGHMSRGDAYKWLQRALGLSSADCHIGMFDVKMCQRVVKVARRKLVELDFGG